MNCLFARTLAFPKCLSRVAAQQCVCGVAIVSALSPVAAEGQLVVPQWCCCVLCFFFLDIQIQTSARQLTHTHTRDAVVRCRLLLVVRIRVVLAVEKERERGTSFAASHFIAEEKTLEEDGGAATASFSWHVD